MHIIGSDEALKGDTFGGIVVAAVKADENIRKKLIDLGVRDSKTLTDKIILSLAPQIEKIAQCHIKSVFPKTYNLVSDDLTALLNALHRECFIALKPGKHIIDKFPGCTVGDIMETHAESKYPEVAAASILARAHALKQMDTLSKRAGFTIPRGSTHVTDALKQLKQSSLPPEEFVKLHFKNVKPFFA
ncbi:MAG TPA: hypothetical protein VJH88_05775 [Candidatus Nanoarchaeia archaeon]|nr:hypothetical protein [Candidatus Nanoarchaeia archaeon]